MTPTTNGGGLVPATISSGIQRDIATAKRSEGDIFSPLMGPEERLRLPATQRQLRLKRGPGRTAEVIEESSGVALVGLNLIAILRRDVPHFGVVHPGRGVERLGHRARVLEHGQRVAFIE